MSDIILEAIRASISDYTIQNKVRILNIPDIATTFSVKMTSLSPRRTGGSLTSQNGLRQIAGNSYQYGVARSIFRIAPCAPWGTSDVIKACLCAPWHHRAGGYHATSEGGRGWPGMCIAPE